MKRIFKMINKYEIPPISFFPMQLSLAISLSLPLMMWSYKDYIGFGITIFFILSLLIGSIRAEISERHNKSILKSTKADSDNWKQEFDV